MLSDGPQPFRARKGASVTFAALDRHSLKKDVNDQAVPADMIALVRNALKSRRPELATGAFFPHLYLKFEP